ncbi:response regulator [Paucidesulfovibrio longus]|uniref:response regulator n=1 Tax=Paucidesulfovibrio longus TaxID=889 RepID=UPI0003B6E2F7|nr:response regulator [Paucidesulfovibrio longus]
MSVATVLLVDDEKAFVEAMTRRLTKRDVDVRAAFSGQECLDALAAAPDVEVVVLDVKMPGIDGVDTLKRIKAEYPLVEVIMLTGHATVETAIDGMKLGAFDYLMKPSDMDVLMEKIDAAATKKRQHEEKIIEARAQSIALRRGD